MQIAPFEYKPTKLNQYKTVITFQIYTKSKGHLGYKLTYCALHEVEETKRLLRHQQNQM